MFQEYLGFVYQAEKWQGELLFSLKKRVGVYATKSLYGGLAHTFGPSLVIYGVQQLEIHSNWQLP